jgi:hypothetical protein
MIEKLFKAGRDPSPLPVIPPMRAGQFGRWRVLKSPGSLMPGYYRDHVEAEHAIVLQERHPVLPKWKTRFSLSPMEQEQMVIPLEEAHGHVLIAGLGLGMTAYNIACKPEVTRVTVIENDRAVIRMWKETCEWPANWPGYGKISVYAGDALSWDPGERKMPEELYPNASAEELEERMRKFAWTDIDLLVVDIWQAAGGLAALSDVSLIAANLQPKAVYYAGQEFDIAQRYADYRKTDPTMTMTPAILEDWIKRTNLPMVGADWPHYHLLAVEAVRNLYKRGAMAKKNAERAKKGKAA